MTAALLHSLTLSLAGTVWCSWGFRPSGWTTGSLPSSLGNCEPLWFEEGESLQCESYGWALGKMVVGRDHLHYLWQAELVEVKSKAVLPSTPYLTLSFLPLLFITGSVRLQRVAAAVKGIVPVVIIQNARKADLPLIAVATKLRIQAQTAAIQVLKAGDALPRHIHDKWQAGSVALLPTTRGSVRGRGKQGNVSRRKVVISKSSWQAAIFKAKGQPHFVGFTVSLWRGWIRKNTTWLQSQNSYQNLC